MIRLFSVFSKLNFIKLTAKQLFDEAAAAASIQDHPCPFCAALHPDWTYFESYERHLVACEHGVCVDYTVTVSRYQCASCGHTHALLPEIAIPYSSYSILFILHAMRDRFIFHLTIDAICRKYLISANTFCRWQALFLSHKKQWLGILEDMGVHSLTFLENLPSADTSAFLCQFWLKCGTSFLQASLHGEKVHSLVRLHPPPGYP